MSQTPPPPPCPRRENDAYLVPSGSTRPRHRGLALLNEDPLIRSLQFLTLREVNDPSRPIIIPPPPRRRPARSTRESDPPTRVQIKRLSEEAERSVHRQGLPVTSKTLFPAMLAIITCQVTRGRSAKPYWAYLPNPPTFQPVTWENEAFLYVPVFLSSSVVVLPL